MNDQDESPPWVRAGGFPQADWLKCLRLSTKRWLAADAALHAAMNREEWDTKAFKDFERARVAMDKAYADHRAVMAGEPEVVGRFFDEIEQGKEGAE